MNRKQAHILILCISISLILAAPTPQTSAAFQGPPAGASPPTGGGLMGVDPNRNIQLFDIQAGSANATPAGALDGAAFGRVFMITADNNPGIGVKDIGADRGYIFTARNNGTLALWDDVARAVRFYVDQSGNIAVGSTDPALAKLHVFGDIRTENNFIGGRMQASYLASDVFGDFTGGGNYAFPAALGVGISSVSGFPANGLYVAGSVGIGTASPGQKLEVVGEIKTKSPLSTSDGVQIGIEGSERPRIGFHVSDNNRRFKLEVNNINTANERLGIFSNCGGGCSETEWLTINKTGNVGIGTTNPGAKLHVSNGVDNASIITWDKPGSRALRSGFTGNTWVLSDSDALSASARLAIDNAGNVGIGTVNPSDKLDVAGNLRILTGSNPIRFTGNWSSFPDSATNQAEISNDTSGFKTLMIVGNKSNDGSTRRVSIWDRLEVNGDLIATGNVGIGTTNPTTKLHVAGDVKVEGDVIANNTGASTEISAANVSQGTFGSLSTKGSYKFEGALNTNPVLFIDATNERVGIGTTAPGYKLEVVPSSPVKFGFTSTGTGYPRLYMGGDSTSVAYIINRIQTSATGYFGEDSDTGGYQLRGTGDINLGTSRVMIKNTGNVGIGTPTPGAKLDIVGGGGITIDLNVSGRIRSNSAAGGVWLSNGGDGFVGNNGNYIGFWTNGVGWALQIEKTTGNVGIGTPTNLDGKLNVKASDDNYFTTDFGLKPSVNDTTQGGIGVQSAGVIGWNAYNQHFFNLNGGTGYHTVMTIKNDKVGIGTTDPQHALDIQGAYYSRMVVKGNQSGTVNINWNDGNVQHITLAGNVTTMNFTGGQSGGRYVLIIKQDGTGGKTVSWPTNVRFPGSSTFNVTTSPNKTDYFGFLYNGVDLKYDNVAFSAAFF